MRRSGRRSIACLHLLLIAQIVWQPIAARTASLGPLTGQATLSSAAGGRDADGLLARRHNGVQRRIIRRLSNALLKALPSEERREGRGDVSAPPAPSALAGVSSPPEHPPA